MSNSKPSLKVCWPHFNLCLYPTSPNFNYVYIRTPQIIDCIYFHTPVCNTLGCGGVLIAWFILRSYFHTPGGVELGV